VTVVEEDVDGWWWCRDTLGLDRTTSPPATS
ncbi:hypothetical protein A2U01_0110408, partial [Trifolium medium]|nr:hypothetical protein [Trifolium medium]